MKTQKRGTIHRLSWPINLFCILLVMAFYLSDNCCGADIGMIDAQALHSGPSGWAVLDARPVDRFAEGHIPGALPFSWENHTRVDARNIPYRTFPPEEMARILGAMGISETTPVVIYGDADTSWGEKAGPAGFFPGSATKGRYG